MSAVNQLRTRIALAWLAGLLVASKAQAGDADAQARSVTLFREGVVAGKAGDYAHAEAAFRESYLLVPSPRALRNWALTEMKVGKMVEALGHLRSALKASTWTAEERAIVQQNFDDAYAATGHVAIATARGASVSIDGVPVEGAAPFGEAVDVAPGHRHVEARLGMQTGRAEVDAAAGQTVQVDVPIEPSEQATPATLSVAAPPVVTEPEHSRLAPSGELEPHSSSWWTTPHAVAIGLGGVAALGIGTGIYFAVASQDAASDVNSLRAGLVGRCGAGVSSPECSALSDKLDTVHQEETLKWIGFAAGAAAGVGAAVLLLLPARSVAVQTGAVRWMPILTPEVSGVAGAF